MIVAPTMHHISEPQLTFGFDQKMIDPRDGITLFGPFTRNQISGQINIGIIGPQKQRDFLKDYLKKIHKPIFGKEGEVARPYFPGLEAAYGIYINFDNLREIDVPQSEIDQFLRYTDSHQRVHNLSKLFVDGLVSYHNREEMPILVWLVAIPEQIYTYGRPKSRIQASATNIRHTLSKRDRNTTQTFLFQEMTDLQEAYQFEVNFHNQLKAKLLNQRIVTQIIRDTKIAYQSLWQDSNRIQQETKFDTDKAWNISNALYYKAGGLPWRLGDVREGVCYLGLVYKKIDFDENDRNACCAAQMFLDSGDGMVFRGNIGPWYNPLTKEFHLSKSDAASLLTQSLEAFKAQSPAKKYPNEIFIHAQTYFDNDEWQGFVEAAEGKSKIIGVRIRDDSSFKIFRDFTYSVPRGTLLCLEDRMAYLWTKGYIPRLQTQMGLETPNPLSVEIIQGEADIQTVCKDILALTKLNYNSCKYGDGRPVTLKFADAIGEVLTAGRDIQSEVLSFKHYI